MEGANDNGEGIRKPRMVPRVTESDDGVIVTPDEWKKSEAKNVERQEPLASEAEKKIVAERVREYFAGIVVDFEEPSQFTRAELSHFEQVTKDAFIQLSSLSPHDITEIILSDVCVRGATRSGGPIIKVGMIHPHDAAWVSGAYHDMVLHDAKSSKLAFLIRQAKELGDSEL